VSTLAVDITKRLKLNVSYVWDRVQNPKPDSSGVVPGQNDTRLVVGLAVDF
jgi:hypothetical protein